MRRLLVLTSLSMIAVLVLAPNAFAQGSFCTTNALASGASVNECVEAPSATSTASPDVTVVDGGTQTASPTSTTTASGVASNPAVAAVGGRLPPTGGGELTLVATALLLGSGVMSYCILRRSD